MSNLSTFSTFQKNWLARSQIAQDEGIPSSAIKSTISNDYNRLLAGNSPMSSQDAFAGMESAGVGHVITQDPSGNGNLATNAFHDAQGIFTGIFHAPEQLLHTGEELVSGTTQALEGKGLAGLKAGLSQAAQLLPGVTDAEQLAKGNFNYLWQHPLFSALDLSGTLSVAGKLADVTRTGQLGAKAAADAEATAAQHAGFISESPNVIPVPNLSKDPITLSNILNAASRQGHPLARLAGRGIRNSPLDPLLEKTLGPWGLYGQRVKDIVRPYNIATKMGQSDYSQILSQLADASAHLEPADEAQLHELMTHPKMGQTPADIMADPTINANVKEAYAGWQHLVDDYNAHAEKSGHNVVITNPHTGETSIVGATSEAAKLIHDHDTKAAKYLTSLTKVQKAQEDYLDLTRPITAPYYKAIDGASVPPDTLLNARDFIATARETLSGMDPRSFINVGTGQFSKDSIRNATIRYKSLFSDTGPFAELTQALQTSDHAAIVKAMGKLKNRTNTKFFNHVPQLQQIRAFIKEYQAADKVSKTKYSNRVATASKNAATAAKRMMTAGETIDKQWRRVTADKYEDVITDIMANKLSDKARLLPMDEDQLTNVLDLLNTGDLNPTGLAPFISNSQWHAIRRSAITEYDKLTASGAKVFWVPKVRETESTGAFLRVGADHLPSVASAHTRALNGSYSIQNPHFALAKSWEDLLARDRSDEFFEDTVKPRLVPALSLKAQSEAEWRMLKETNPKKAPKSHLEYFNHMYSNWHTFNPHVFFHPNSRHINVYANEPEMMISDADHKLLQHMSKTVNNPATRVWDSSLSIFRNSVLTISPRFFAHITLGGAFMTSLLTGPSILKYFSEAHDLVTEGKPGLILNRRREVSKLPASISTGTGYGTASEDIKLIYDPAQTHLFMGGRSIGRWLTESAIKKHGLDPVAAKAQAYHEFLETWSDHYRAMAYLYGKNRAIRKDDPMLTQDELDQAKKASLTPFEYAGVKLANKVLADNLSKTPLERSLIRFIFPFGGWSKHVLRYVFQLPMDHPLRTNFLSNLFEQSYEADTSGLPQYLFHLLMLGHPDANGNVSTIDFRQWNPLRDVANYMTLSGIVSQLNPLAGGVLNAMGIDAATGSPELYPQLSYNDFYGGYQPQTPTGQTPFSILSSYIPEFGVLDHYLKLSSYTRSLARYDPAAFNKQLWQALNIPWSPQQININQIIAKQEDDRLNELKTMATSALAQNDPSQLNGQNGPFPFDGWYFSSGQIKSIINAANEWTKQTGIQLPASALLQTPSAPSIPLGITPPVTLAPEELAGSTTTGQPSS